MAEWRGTVRTFYLISDLHIGEDEALGVCDFEDELIDFLETIAAKADEDIELEIVGDAYHPYKLPVR